MENANIVMNKTWIERIVERKLMLVVIFGMMAFIAFILVSSFQGQGQTVDYIAITDSPDGTNLTTVDLPIGGNVTAYASGYNFTGGIYVGLVEVDWTQFPLTMGSFDNLTANSTTFTAGLIAGIVDINGTNSSFPSNQTDNFTVNILSPTIDLIVITDMPDGTPLVTVPLPIGGTVTAYASGYNNTGPTYVGLVEVDWSGLGGGWAPTPANTSTYTAGTVAGLYTQTGQNLSMIPSVSDTFDVDILPPTVDYITLTDTPDGTAHGTVNLNVGGSVLAYASGYNNTGPTYVSLVDVDWTPLGGSFDNATDTSSTYTAGMTGGLFTQTGQNATMSVLDTFDVDILPPTVDWIDIVDTAATGATSIADQAVDVGYTITGWAASFNTTAGYIGDIVVTWAVDNTTGATASTSDGGGDNDTFDASINGGVAWWYAAQSQAQFVNTTTFYTSEKGDSDMTNIFVDLQGNIHMVFIDNRSNVAYVVYKLLDNEGNVLINDTQIHIPPIPNSARKPRIVVDTNGFAHIFWKNGSNNQNHPLFYTKIDPSLDDQNGDSAIDSNIVIIDDMVLYDMLEMFDVVIDPLNNIHLAISNFSFTDDPDVILYMKLDDAGNKLVPETVIGTGGYTAYPHLNLDSNENLHIIWTTNTGQSTDSELTYVMLDNDGNVLINETLISEDDGLYSKDPALALDSDDNVHLVWRDENVSGGSKEIFYMKFDPYLDDQNGDNASIDAMEVVAETLLSIDDGIQDARPVIAVGTGDIVHVFWANNWDNNYDGIATYQALDKTGTPIIPLQTLSGPTMGRKAPCHQDIATDPAGRVYLAWPDDRGPNTIAITKGYLGHVDSVIFNINPPTIDWIDIVNTTGTGATTIADQTVDVGYTITGWAASFNTTAGYLGDIVVTWAVDNATGATASTSDGGGDNDTFDAGVNGGVAWWYAEQSLAQFVNTTTFYTSEKGAPDIPNIFVDLQGNIHMVFIETGGTNHNVTYKLLDNNGNVLINDTIIDNGTNNTRRPSIVVDTDGFAHIFWKESGGGGGDPCQPLYYTKIDPNLDDQNGDSAIDSNIVIIDDMVLYDKVQMFDVVIDPLNNIHLAISNYSHANNPEDNNILYMKLDDAGNKLVPETVVGLGGYKAYPHLDFDSNNNIHIVWTTLGEYGISTNCEINYTMLDSAGAVLIGETMISKDDGFISKEPALALDSDDNIHLVWRDENVSGGSKEIFYMKFDPYLDDRNGDSADISAMEVVPEMLLSIDDGVQDARAVIAVGTGDIVHVFWANEWAYGDGIATYLALDKTGTPIIPLQTLSGLTLGGPQSYAGQHGIATDPAGRVYLAWPDDRGPNTIAITKGYLGHVDSVIFNINPPTVDYILITDAPDGVELSTVSLPIGGTVTAYASGYNNTGPTYVGLVEVDWSGLGGGWAPTPANTSTYTSGTVAGLYTQTGQNLSMIPSVSDTFDVDILPPTLDYILITVAPNGAELTTETLPIGGTVTAYASGYNNTGPTYVGLVEVDWSGLGGGWAPTPANTSTYTAGTVAGLYAQTGQNLSYPVSDTFDVDILPPTVDYITLTDTPDGTALGTVNLNVGGSVLAYASGYNNTGPTYVGLVEVDWTPLGGSFDNATDTSSTYTAGMTGGVFTQTGQNATMSVLDTFDVNIAPPTVDWIDIVNTAGTGGSSIADQAVDVGFTIGGWAAAYNNTAGYLYDISVTWTAVNEGGVAASTYNGTGINDTFNAGVNGGISWWNAEMSLAQFLNSTTLYESELGDSLMPNIFVDLQGNIHMVFIENISNTGYVTYKLLDNDGNVLINDTRINSGTDSRRPRIVVDTDGFAHIFWKNGSSGPALPLFYTKIDPSLDDQNGDSAIDSNIVIIDDMELYDEMEMFDVVIDPFNNIHLAISNFTWANNPEDNRILYMKLDDAGNKLIPETSVGTGGYKPYPHLSLDSNENVHIIYTTPGSNTDSEVYYVMLDNVGNVLIDETLISEDDGLVSKDPAIALDSDDNVHLVWRDENVTGGSKEIFYMKFDPSLDDRNGDNASIDAMELVAETLLSIDDGTQDARPVIAVGTGDIVHVFWANDWDNSYDAYAHYLALDKTGTPIIPTQRLTSGPWMGRTSSALHLDIATDPAGRVYLAWPDDRGPNTIAIAKGHLGHVDSVIFNINPPTVDYILITDAPNGAELTTETLPIGGTVTAYASGYNNTGPTYVGLVEVDWSGLGGSWSPITNESSIFTAGTIAGLFTQTGQNGTLSDTFDVDILPPTVDYILITDAPNGAELTTETLPVGGSVTAYASGYNNTGPTYVSLVDVDWAPLGGSFDNLTGTSSTYTAGMTGGLFTQTGQNATMSVLDTFDVNIAPPTVDWIDIVNTAGTGGSSIADQAVDVGFTIGGWAAAYNNTAGYLYDISVTWTAVNEGGAAASTYNGTGINDTFNAGVNGGISWWNAEMSLAQFLNSTTLYESELGDSLMPNIFVDLQGNIHMVFIEKGGNNDNVTYKLLDNNGNVLINDTTIDNGTNNTRRPRIVVDTDGFAHIFWKESGVWTDPSQPLYYTKINPNLDDQNGDSAIDSNIVIIDDMVLYDKVEMFDAVIDPFNNIHLAISNYSHANNPEDNRILYMKLDDAGNKLIPETSVGTGGYKPYPHLDFDSNNNIHIVWTTGGLYGDSSNCEINYTMLDSAGAVLIGETMISKDDGNTSKEPALALDSDDNIHLVWRDTNVSGGSKEIFYMKFDPYLDDRNGDSADISAMEVVPEKLLSIDDGTQDARAVIAVGTGDIVHVFWANDWPGGWYDAYAHYLALDKTGTPIIPTQRLTSGPWMGRSSSALHLDIAIDPAGSVYLAWPDDRGSNTIAIARGHLGLVDSVIFNINPPTVDYILITDAPNGAELTTETLPIGGTVTAYASGYNNTGPTYVGLVEVDWSGLGGGWAPTPANTSTYTAGTVAGLYTQTGQNLSMIPSVSDTFDVDILPPTVDYILITDAPNGAELTTETLPIGGTVTAYASGYNNTGLTYVGLVEVDWSGLGGGWAPTPANTSTYTAGTVAGLFTQTGQNLSMIPSVSDTFDVDILPPTLDYILITDSPDGNELTTVNINIGEQVEAFASGYNNTGPTYVGLVEADWSDVPDLGTFNNDTGTSTIFTAGFSGGTTNILAQNVTVTDDAFTIIIAPPTVDYILITDTPNGAELATVNLDIGGQVEAFASGYNNTGSTYVDLVNVDWIDLPDLGSFNNDTGTSTIFTAGFAGGITTITANLTIDPQINDIFSVNIYPPTVDYILITDAPDGNELTSVVISIVDSIQAYASGYNSTGNTYVGLVDVDWSANPPVLGSFSTNLGNTTIFYASGTAGTVTVTGENTSMAPPVSDSFTADIQNLTVDYILITHAPNGTELLTETLPIGGSVTAYASGYNTTAGMYVGLVEVDWGQSPSLGSFDNQTGNSTTFTAGYGGGLTTITGQNASLGVSDSFDVDILPPTLDYINITDAPDGNELTTVTLPVGSNVTVYASGYNNTNSTYVGLVNVNWTDLPDLGSFDNLTGTSTTFTAGFVGGLTTIKGENITMTPAVNDSFEVDILPPTVDRIEITDMLYSEILDSTVDVGYNVTGIAALFNSTSGFISTIDANWTAVGLGSAIPSIGPTSGITSWINAGNSGGIVWWNVSYFDGMDWFNDTVIFTVNPPTVDYLDITDIPDGTPIVDATVDIGFSIWGNASLYNTTAGFLYTISADWTNESLDGATPSGGPSPAVFTWVNVGLNQGTVMWNASYYNGTMWFYDTVTFTVSPPEIDNIVITDTPDGAELTTVNLDIGQSVTAYASGYNSSASVYIDLVDVDWSASISLGVLDTATGNSTTFTAGYTGGTLAITGENLILVLTDAFTVDIAPPTVDYINITDAPDGSELTTVDIFTNGNLTAYASGYNSTGPAYVGLVEVVWTDTPDLGTFDNGTGTNTIFTAGLTDGITTIRGQNNTLGIDNDFTLNVIKPTIDYILITDTDATEIQDQTVPVGFSILCTASAFNNTVGYFTIVDVTWTVSNTGGAEATTSDGSGTTETFNAGSAGGTATWTAEDTGGSTDTVVFTITAPTVDSTRIVNEEGDLLTELSLKAGETQTVYAMGYNSTSGEIGHVSVDWSVSEGATLSDSTGTSTTITAGDKGGTFSVDADYNGITESVSMDIAEKPADELPIVLMIVPIIVVVIVLLLLFLLLKRKKKEEEVAEEVEAAGVVEEGVPEEEEELGGWAIDEGEEEEEEIEKGEGDEEEFECPDCGATLTPDLTKCPSCGLEFEFIDEEEGEGEKGEEESEDEEDAGGDEEFEEEEEE